MHAQAIGNGLLRHDSEAGSFKDVLHIGIRLRRARAETLHAFFIRQLRSKRYQRRRGALALVCWMRGEGIQP